MKKIVLGCVLASLLGIAGCGNIDLFDTNFTFNRALVRWPDGTMKEIQIKQWRDYEGEQYQIVGKDGKVYLISSFNSVLIRD